MLVTILCKIYATFLYYIMFTYGLVTVTQRLHCGKFIFLYVYCPFHENNEQVKGPCHDMDEPPIDDM